MSEKRRTGPISVTDDVTPITQQKVELVDATLWSQMSLTQLWDQRTILESRMLMASAQNPSMAVAMKKGLAQLDAIIQHKFNEQDDDMKLL